MTQVIGLQDFIKKGLERGIGHNQWLRIKDRFVSVGMIYLRVRGPIRHFSSQLDISSVQIHERYTHKGHFKKVLAEATEACREHGIEVLFIENVMAPELAAWLDKQTGWVKGDDMNWDVPSYYFNVLEKETT